MDCSAGKDAGVAQRVSASEGRFRWVSDGDRIEACECCGWYWGDDLANLCSITIIHRVKEETEKLGGWFGQSEREVNWVRTAKAGNDKDGYSEALMSIDEEGRFPLRVRASDFEAEVVSEGVGR